MELIDVIYRGETPDDREILDHLPVSLANLLSQINGFVQLQGGVHLRGACQQPEWHSLRQVWWSDRAFHRFYPEVLPEDVPFAEDCVGDQFLLRGEAVYHLAAETGEVTKREDSLGAFLQIQADPIAYLSLYPLLKFRNEGGELQPGQLLSVYPPFCSAEAAQGVSITAVPSDDRHARFSLSTEGNPEFATVLKVLKALGLRLQVVAV